MTIFLDFDGTMVEHAYPALGEVNPFALEVVKKLQEKGHTIILNTYRSNINDGTLQVALHYLNNHATVILQSISPTKEKFYPEPFLTKNGQVAIYKAENGEDYLYIDDMQPDIPLIPAVATSTDMVDWTAVETLLIKAGIL